MMDLQIIALNPRNSIKRAVARFCLLNKLSLMDYDFDRLVRRVQDGGYPSAVKWVTRYLTEFGYSTQEKKEMLYRFTIEYNTEMYLRQFPKGNRAVERIIAGNREPEDNQFFQETLYDIVKANKLQKELIDKQLAS